MTIFDKIFARLGYFPHLEENKPVQQVEKQAFKKSDPKINRMFPTPIFGAEAPNKTMEDYLKANVSWVYACIKAIASNIAATSWKLFRRKGDNVEEIKEHEILDVLYKANDLTSKYDHFYLTQAYLETAGEAPWYLSLDASGKPQAILVLRPDRLRIEYSSETIISKYIYQVDPFARKEITLAPEELIILKESNLTSPFRGYSVLQAMVKTYNIDEFAEKWNENFFYNSARPDVVISTDQKLSDQVLRKLKDSWNKVFQGYKKVASTAFMHSGLKADVLTRSAKDMEFVKLLEYTRDKILAMYGVPGAILGLTADFNRANMDAATYAFSRWTIKPRLQKLCDQLNEFFVPYFADDLFLDFDDPVPDDRASEVKYYETALYKWLTINEIREMEGYEAVQGGDVLYVPNNLTPTGEIKKETKLLNYDPENIKSLKARMREGKKIAIYQKIEKKIENIAREVVAGGKIKSFGLDEQKMEIVWQKQIKLQEEAEKKFIRLLRNLFNKQEEIILRMVGYKAINKIVDPEDATLDKAAQVRLFVEIFKPLLEKLLKNEGKRIVEEFDLKHEFTFTELIDKYLKNKTIKFADEVNEITNQKIVAALREGIKEGEGIYKLRERVRTVFKEANTVRAEMIARTETSRAMGHATEEAFKQNGIKKKVWFTANDERTCEFCAPMNGKEIIVGKSFYKLGDKIKGEQGGEIELTYENIQHPPLHPRCYDKETEILTIDNGWRLIKDIQINEHVWTLNPETKNMEVGIVINTIKEKVQKILHLTNKQNSFNMAVSENHPFFGYKRVDHDPKPRIIEAKFYDSIKKLPKSEFRFYASSEWQGKNVNKIILGNKKLTTENYCKFFGYYLSEGSVTKRKKGGYQISIAQSKYLQEMYDDIIKMGFDKVCIGKDKIYIFDQTVAKELLQYGKSYQKYIPRKIKVLNPIYLRIFLDAFLLGDGSVKKAKHWKNGNFEDTKIYCTSSQKMADDLGEIIIKVGKSVSYHLERHKGKRQQFKNGIYIINHNLWIITELTSKYRMFTNIITKYIDYNNFVYDLEVNKNNTILTRRNGRIVWGSNCRCTLAPIVE